MIKKLDIFLNIHTNYYRYFMFCTKKLNGYLYGAYFRDERDFPILYFETKKIQ
ncbi:MAG: hypothetical protein LBS39_00870 [Campylobacteraceae bacterium]|nr:hypothetical protein [Campylobacteraceae bacterium]